MNLIQPVQLDAQEYIQVIDSVFSTMLDACIEACDATPAQEKLATAVIYFAGSWSGALLLQCELEGARMVTERLMRVALPPGMNDDVRDSLAEISNMIAGNLKAVLPPGAMVSIPLVFEGNDYAIRFTTHTETQVAFTCCDHLFRAALLGFSERG